MLFLIATSHTRNASDTLDLETASSVTTRQSQPETEINQIEPGPSYNPTPTENAVTGRRQSFTLAGLRRTRIMWTNEMNKAVIQFYFKSTKLETDLTNYRIEMLQLFNAKFPRFSDRLNEAKLVERKRYILKYNKLSTLEISNIKLIVERELENNMNDSSSDTLNQETLSTSGRNFNINFSTMETVNEEIIMNTQEEELYSDLSYNMNLALTLYLETDPTKRLLLPKLRYSNKLCQILKILNERILPTLVVECNNIQNLQTIIYCSAYATCLTIGLKMSDSQNRRKAINNNKYPWMLRLEKQIDKIRKKLGRLTQFKNGGRSTKLLNRINREIIPNVIEELDSNQFTELLYSTTQRLRILSERLKRYTKRDQRHRENNDFEINASKFYQKIKSKNVINNTSNQPNIEEITNFWSSIWETPETYNTHANWIKEERNKSTNLTEMISAIITENDINETTKRTHNWKSPGIDNIHNFWYKKLICIHSKMAALFNEILECPSKIPTFLMQGMTYLIQKDPNICNVSNYRPITCLPTIYKIFTSIISHKINQHCIANNIITIQQKGCGIGSRGCKDQIIIDSIIVGQAKTKDRNLNMAYIDYEKAYDSMPHSYMLEILKIYKINRNIIGFFNHVAKHWNTTLHFMDGTTQKTSRKLHIRRGIFQGDAFSSQWFCLGMNPLSNILNETKYGFEIKSNEGNYKVNHLFYMDDLKLFASSKDQLHQMLYISEQFSKDINMHFNTQKTKMIHLYRGNLITTSGYITENDEIICDISSNEHYKYLGFAQLRGILHTDVKARMKQMFKKRMNEVLKTLLNSKNKIKAINQYVIPYLTYSFGIIKWSPTDIADIERDIRKCFRYNHMHDPKSAIERMDLPRNLGGRGILNIKNLYCNQFYNLREYFFNIRNNCDLYKIICAADDGFTPLHLKTINYTSDILPNTIEQAIDSWKRKTIHGVFPNHLDNESFDKKASNAWLIKGEIFGETEGFMMSIQDRVVPTRNYRKYILKENVENDKCRMCGMTSENIDHITNGCSSMAATEYLTRHNKIAKIIHQRLANRLGFVTENVPYYKYEPTVIFEDNNNLLFWDKSIETDKEIIANRPDIVYWDKRKQKMFIIDIAIPLNQTTQSTYTEKMRKYSDLQTELKRIWKLRESFIIPIVISSTGLVPYKLTESLNKLGMENEVENIQKAVILETCRIVRKFLNN